MKPKIDSTDFGSIIIAGDRIEHDVTIRLSDEVTKRKKKLSKAVYGTSHTISPAEAEYIYEKGAERLIVGAGQNGLVELSDEAAAYFAEKHAAVCPGNHNLAAPAGLWIYSIVAMNSRVCCRS